MFQIFDFLLDYIPVRMLSRFSHVRLLQLHGLWPAMLLCPWTLRGKTLEWVAMPSSRGSSQLGDWNFVFCISLVCYPLSHLGNLTIFPVKL